MASSPNKTLPEPPYKVQFTDANGYVSPPWLAWINQLFNRVGGTIALTNKELESTSGTSLTALQAQVDELASEVDATNVADSLGIGRTL